MDQQICKDLFCRVVTGVASPRAKRAIYVSNRRARELAAIAHLRSCPAVHGVVSREMNRVADRKARGLRTRSRRGRRGRRTRGRVRQRGLQPRASGAGTQGVIPRTLPAPGKPGSSSFSFVDAITRPTRGVRRAVRYLNGLNNLAQLPQLRQAQYLARMVDAGASLRGVSLTLFSVPCGPGEDRTYETGCAYLRLWRNLQRRILAASRRVGAVDHRLYEKLVVEDNQRRYMALLARFGGPQPPVTSP